ncbi:MAG: PolC-type DNA polymerase III [Firmicutes bacterium]|nr:PolC-type DNA polymerase III [Bacillota bacterium]
MRELFEKYIDWEEVKASLDGEPEFKVKRAVIRKDESILEIDIALNFLVPGKDEAMIKAAIMDKYPLLKDVEFRYDRIKASEQNASEQNASEQNANAETHQGEEEVKDALETAEEKKARLKAKKEKAEEKKKKNAAWRKRRANQRARELPAIGKAIMGGKAIPEKAIPISEVSPEVESVVTGGVVFGMESKVLKSESVLAMIYITDNASSICLKTFISPKKWEEIEKNITIGDYIKVKGQPEFDQYERALVVTVDNIEKGEVARRQDNFLGKHRVELHCHTKMSRLDGLNDVETIIDKASEWKQPAVAITDHGVVQSFPDAAKRAKKAGIKVIYGREGYVFDDGDCIKEDGSIDYKKNPTYHIIFLASTQTGITNLYRLVSTSHLDYFYKRPRLPKSIIEKYREGIILGSACEAGEVYRAVAAGMSDEELDGIASFYDYLEIQPLINNQFMIDKGEVRGREDLREFNRRIIECGDRLGKLTVATTDAHYDEPESAIFRNVIMGGMGFEDAENGQGLYLRTTEEMLDEFSYLGEELAYKVVVENTNAIADMIEDGIRPVPEEKCPPTIPNADTTLRESCMARAHELYGENLPPQIEERLNTELDSIIGNGYSVMYVSAQMLINKSRDDGYPVGSRGSVGSSFAATMAGVTEVNPLDPHYVCPNCKHFEFGDRKTYDCGVDMPVKNCPECGTEMIRDGYTIPFATFLGFDGTKEPDIDLNFAGEYQAKAHKYVEEIFGAKNIFKAGTVSKLEEKTAYRYLRKYCEVTGDEFSKYEETRLARGCMGVKSTTGQHPGGIVIVPDDREIYEFCPIQHPANKAIDIVTTHFDYHKIEKNLLKLDILGHTGPTMQRYLYEITGVNPIDIDMNDQKVISIFSGVEALDIRDPEYQFTDGTYGIPEFGTSFVRGMLQEIKPKKIGDLVRIAGFSHGEDVWQNNAQEYVKSGVATMNEVISTRDDIMNYLMLKGLENVDAFNIMETVRKKDRVLNDEQKALMKEHDVPNWYIDSCDKIKYMFPRAHAAAYVINSFRMSWYKVYYPQAFYAAYFTENASGFDTEIILRGPGACYDVVRRIRSHGEVTDESSEDEGIIGSEQKDESTDKDKRTLKCCEVAYEMYARGYDFKPPKLGASHARRFTVEGNSIRLPYVALEGVGLSAATSIYEAYEDKPFFTLEDAISRAKINKTALEALNNYGVFEGLPETDQVSFF